MCTPDQLIRQRAIDARGQGDAPVVGPLMRRNATDAGDSWRKSWGGRDPDTVTLPDLLDVTNAHRAAEVTREWRRGRDLLFWLLCIDLGALVAYVVTR